MNKFNTLLETNITRFQGSGLLPGDIVKFKSNAMSSDWSKKQASNLLEKLKEFTECEENIRVSCVKSLRPAVGGGQQAGHQVDDFYCDVVREKAPGLFMDFITVPAELLEYQEQGINLPEVPASQRKNDKIEIEPGELSQEAGGDPTLPYDQTGVNEGDKQLPTDNHTQENNPAPVDNFTTKVYMQGLR